MYEEIQVTQTEQIHFLFKFDNRLADTMSFEYEAKSVIIYIHKIENRKMCTQKKEERNQRRHRFELFDMFTPEFNT